MDGNNLNVLVEAKKESMEQLCSLLCPLMIETFLETYREAVKMSKNKQVLIQYQKLLKEVPNWNNHIVKQHTTRLCDACSWFSDLLAAVFVSCVKILSSVRLNAENKKISVKLPSNEVFVHGCYVAAAKELYKDPYIYHDQNVSEYEREANLSKRFTLCIEETVKAMIPIQQILHTYISNGEQMAEKNLDFDNTEEEVVDEPELNEEDEEVEEEQPAEVDATPPPTTDPAPAYVPEETKSIPVSNPPPQTQGEGEGDDDVLFPGAPETVTKNPQ
jgi:hypothetical protein